MRLFLSSQDLGNYGEIARKMAGNNPKVAYIKNSQDDKSTEERNFSTPEKKKMFEALGFEFEELDLRDYFNKKQELAKKISSFGSVFCAGGNTFILRRAMKASGLDAILVDLLNKDKIMYGGWSAGACVASKSLDGIQFGDRPSPEIVPKDYPEEVKVTPWEGLGLIDFMLVPHCNMDWFKIQADATVNYMEEHSMPYKTLNDGQVYIINGDKKELLQ